uniref:Phospholipid/glycerol acyltransferase domain-containing protein n=1 Tax=Percolomonas cosmopolitus TaxID=63605 RepID=A0A7S1KNP4_9EUKA
MPAAPKKTQQPTPLYLVILHFIAHQAICYFHGTLIAGILFAQLICAPIRFFVSIPAYRFIDSVMCQWGMINFDMMSEYTGRKWNFRFFGDDMTLQDQRKNFLVVCNHCCTVDWVYNMHFAAFHWSASKVRFFMKRDHLMAPIVGWAAYLHDMIFLKRTDREFDLKTISDKLASFRQYGTQNWLWLYPEGTFVTPNRTGTLEKVRAYAERQGWPVMEYVLNPRTTAFVLCLKGKNKECFDSVLDVTVAFGAPHKTKLGLTLQPQMVNSMRFDKAPVDIFYHVKKHPIVAGEFPEEDDDVAQWLHDRFTDKEKLLEYFDKNGTFPGPERPVKRPWQFHLIFFTTMLTFAYLTYFFFVHARWFFYTYWTFLIVCMLLITWYDNLQGHSTPPQKKQKTGEEKKEEKKNQ